MSNKYDLIGAKGGGGSFRNTPDNLRSTDTFEALIGLCSGRIKGLAPGGLKNLFIDDVPIEDGLGNTNLKDFTAVLFDGDPAILQPVKLNLGGSSGATTINLAVNNPYGGSSPGDWRNGVVSQIGVDFIDLRFVVNALYRQDKTGIYSETARLEIQLQPSGSTTWINPLESTAAPSYVEDGYVISDIYGTFLGSRNLWDDTGNAWRDNNPGYLTLSGKTTQPYIKELRISVPNSGVWANKTWNVRVRLMERDTYTNDQDEERRTIVWESVAGVDSDTIGNREEWRGLAYLHINGKATDQLTGIPNVNGIYDLSVFRVPPASVWNAETRVYTGAAWDGVTEEIKWSTCPAFQLKDLIEDGVSGISALVPGTTLNKWDALEASKWYAQLVPDGNGGFHPRYSMNFLLDQSLSVNDVIQYVAGAVGSYCYDEGDGKWRLVVDKPESATAIFTKENIVGEFTYTHTDIDTRINDITAVYRDEARRFEETRVRIFDQAHIDTYGRNHQSIALVGCTNRQEALRRTKLRQLVSLNETRSVTFTTNRQGRLLTPFSVILVADQDLGLANLRTTGRLTSRTGTTLTVRDPVRLELGVAYKVHVTVPNPDYNPDATSQPSSANWKKPTITVTRDITNTAGQRGDVTTLYIDSDLPSNTPSNAPIAFEAVGLPTMPKQYRVLSVEPNDSNEEVTISAIEIYTNKWAESDAVVEGEVLSQTSKRVTPAPETPEGGMFGVKTFTGQFNNGRRVLTASWLRPASMWVEGFKVEYSLNDGAWQLLAEKTADNYVELTQPINGFYTFRVYTVDRRGGISPPLTGTYELTDISGDYAPISELGPLADRPVTGTRIGQRYTTTDQSPNETFVWDGTEWKPESNYVTDSGQIAHDPNTLIVAEKLTLIVSEEARRLNTEQLASRGTSNGLYALVTAMTQAQNDWLAYRNSLTPAWNDITTSSSRVWATWNDLNNAYDNSISTLNTALQPNTWYQPTPPTAEETYPLHRWVNTDDVTREYIRGTDELLIGGELWTLGGVPWTITWFPLGNHAADNTIANVPLLDYSPPRTINCDPVTTLPFDGQFPDKGSIRVQRNGVSIKSSPSTTYRIKNVVNLDGAFVDNTDGSLSKGDWVVEGMSANSGLLEIEVSVEGVPIGVASIPFSKSIPTKPATGTAGFKTFTSFPEVSLSGTTDTAIITPVKLSVATGETINCSMSLDYAVGGDIDQNKILTATVQYSSDGLTGWTDWGAPVSGTLARARFREDYLREIEWAEPSPGNLTSVQTKSGLAAQDWYVRVVAKLNSSGSPVTIWGPINWSVS